MKDERRYIDLIDQFYDYIIFVTQSDLRMR